MVSFDVSEATKRAINALTPKAFETLAYMILRTEFPTIRPLDPPDGGADLVDDGPPKRVWQAKRSSKINWSSCRESLHRATLVHEPKRVTFIFPNDLTAQQNAAFQRLQSEAPPGVAVDVVTFSWFDAELSRPELSGVRAQLLTQRAFDLNPAPVVESKISTARLPATRSELFGRSRELRLLDETWEKNTANIIVLVAWAGVGKTALINYWLRQLSKEHHRGAEQIFAWSFYTQGTADGSLSSDQFIDSALRHFGDVDPIKGSPWDKGERLANLIRLSRTLLILDGLEPLQHQPGPEEGKLKDLGMIALLRELAADQPGLCIISTRLGLTDLSDFERTTVISKDLGYLSPQAGAQVLRSLGVKAPSNEELKNASRDFGGHALALTLLGSYLCDVWDGDIFRRWEIDSLQEDVRYGGHAKRVIASYEKWLGDGPELAFLRILGLFNRPADGPAVHSICAPPFIPDLNDALQGINEQTWRQAVSKLRRIKLLMEPSSYDPEALDTHPLIRQYFSHSLKSRYPHAWQEGNGRLCEYLLQTTEQYPETIEEMVDLYSAIHHGCESGKYHEMLWDVYWNRIRRGEESFSVKKLALFETEVSALKHFFNGSWESPVSSLDEASKALLFGDIGFDLQALGRFHDSIQLLRLGLELRISREEWKLAAVSAENISRLLLNIGDLRQALSFAKQGVALATRSDDLFQQSTRTTMLAYVLFHKGEVDKAAELFRLAEHTQSEWNAEFSYAYSIRGFRYCCFLLWNREVDEVQTRALYTLKLSIENKWPLDTALGNLSLGRALCLMGELGSSDQWTQSRTYLTRAVDSLRELGRLDYIPHALIARAALFRVTRNYAVAKRDLEEALRIAMRCGMGLYQADCHLEYARIYLDLHQLSQAKYHCDAAKAGIKKMAYHLRDHEVLEIERET